MVDIDLIFSITRRVQDILKHRPVCLSYNSEAWLKAHSCSARDHSMNLPAWNHGQNNFFFSYKKSLSIYHTMHSGLLSFSNILFSVIKRPSIGVKIFSVVTTAVSDSPALSKDSSAAPSWPFGPYCSSLLVHETTHSLFSRAGIIWFYHFLGKMQMTLIQEAQGGYDTKKRAMRICLTLANILEDRPAAELGFIAVLKKTLDNCGVCTCKDVQAFSIWRVMVRRTCTRRTLLIE